VKDDFGRHARTLAVHAGRHDLRELGVHAPPIDLSTTFPLGPAAEAGLALDSWASGETGADRIYARLHNQTVERFEQGVAELEATESCVAFSSGMAALSAALISLEQPRHVVAIRPLYGTSEHLLESGPLDVEVSWADPDTVASALRPETKLVVLETPRNPTLALVDIASVVEQSHGVPVLVDNTFATPILQRPLEHGATAVLHSATKFLGGHGDAVGGVIASGESFAAGLRKVRLVTGALLHPFAAYLLHRGLPTLPLRVEAAQQTASELTTRFIAHPDVVGVHHPSIDPAFADLQLRKQMSGPGALMSIELDSLASALNFVQGLELALHAVSLGGFDTLVEHPASLTHRVLGEDGRAAGGISDSLVRISVGLEDVDDLWFDFEQAIAISKREDKQWLARR
jgi:methionine-gamma-lyase